MISSLFADGMIIDGLMVGNFGETFIQRNVKVGIKAANCTVAGHSDSNIGAMLKMEQHRWVVDKMAAESMVIGTAVDLEAAQKQRKFGVIMGFQGAEPLGTEFHLLSVFWRLGLRILGLTYNNRNALGDGCLEPDNRGLTHFGIEIVRDCANLGIVVDLSHAGERTSLHAVEVSEKPCIFSHSNPAFTHPNPRNLTDAQMKAMVETGGVMGISAWSNFVGDCSDGRHPTIEDYAVQIDKTVQHVGIDHVGIGSDIFVGRSHDV